MSFCNINLYLENIFINLSQQTVKMTDNKQIKEVNMAKIIKKAETMFSRFERSLEELADKIL